MTDGSKNCGSKEAEPGQGQLCGRLSSELCYETQERPCNVGKDFHNYKKSQNRKFGSFLKSILKIFHKMLRVLWRVLGHSGQLGVRLVRQIVLEE